MENPRLQNVLHRLDKVTNTGDGWMACCPAHDDRNPSLSIKTAGTKILLHCFAGCSIENIAQAIGLEVKDLHLDEPKAQPNTFYEYQDEQGNLLFKWLEARKRSSCSGGRTVRAAGSITSAAFGGFRIGSRSCWPE